MSEAKIAEKQSQAEAALYRFVVPLRAEEHGDFGVRSEGISNFASGMTAVAISAAEYGHVMRHYPIVFSTGTSPTALAITGIEAGTNLFVDAAGIWRPGTYIPAFIRRCPFIAVGQPNSDELVLCIDKESELLTQGEGRPLFDGGEPTQLVKEMLVFCRDYYNSSLASGEFVTALATHQVLVPNTAQITLKSGRSLQVTDFQVIDEARFNALPGEVVLDWRRRGWLPLLYAVLFSAANWEILVGRAGASEPRGQ